MNPKRHPPAAARGVEAPPPQNVSPAPIPAPKARSTAHVSFALVLPLDYSPRRRGDARAASSAPKTLFKPERMVRLPKVVIHSPVWGDKPAKVDHPGSSCGTMLEVPNLNRQRMRMDLEDLIRFYPDEWAVEHNRRVQRARERRARNAAARRQASQATPTTPPRSGSVATPTSPPIHFYV